MNKWWSSSANPEELGMALKGVSVVGAVSVIVAILGLLGVDLDSTQVTNVLENLLQGIGGLMIAYGLVRKIIIKMKKPS